MIICIDCGCTKEEAQTQAYQYCLDGRHHRFRSTEERSSIGHKHKERNLR